MGAGIGINVGAATPQVPSCLGTRVSVGTELRGAVWLGRFPSPARRKRDAGFLPPGRVIYLLPCERADGACRESSRRLSSRVACPRGHQLKALIGQGYIKICR